MTGLRNSLAEGNLAARLYAERLTRFLDWVDHFFDDAGKANQTLFPHAFGLRTSAPLWTASAFDRCLLLALIYPVAAIFVIWAISGHVGPAETALRLKSGLSGWQRSVVATGVGFPIFGSWRIVRLHRSLANKVLTVTEYLKSKEILGVRFLAFFYNYGCFC
jgi:hypothetical protein